MVFVRKVKTASGATAVQIAEHRGGRDRVLEHVGSAHSEAELMALLAVARERMHPGQGELDFSGGRLPAGAAPITGKSSVVLWQVLTDAYARLGFGVLGDQAFEQLVLARIVEPTSKADSVRVLDELGVEHVSLRTMFRTLERVGAGGYRDTIATACFAHAATSGDLSLCLYDVTTLYFEAEKEDNLRKVGFSKERRVDPQVVVGLLVDRAGFPLEIGCYEGNTAETTTLLPMITAFRDRHQVADMVVVADAGMLSAANLAALDAADLRFIVGSRATKAPHDLASHFRWHGTSFRDGQTIETITAKTARSREENNPLLKAEPVWDPRTHPGSWRALWAYSSKRAQRDTYTLTQQENRAKAVIAGEKAAGSTRFVNVSKGAATLRDDALKRARALVGLKGYITNIPADVMPAAEVIASYHELWHVEQSFRMSKTDLRARPMFHHTKEAIDAHLTIVFAALAVARHLQDLTGTSIKRIVQTLRPLQQITIQIGPHQHLAADPLTPAAKHILNAIKRSTQTH